MNILVEGRIRATDTRYLSDSSEFTHALEFARALILGLRKAETGARAEYLDAVTEALQFRAPPTLTSYVSCFCASPDELDLWRAFAPPDAGYCFGFDWSANADNEVVIGKCIYAGDEKKAIIEERLWHFHHVDVNDIDAMVHKHGHAFRAGSTSSHKRGVAFALDFADVRDSFQRSCLHD